MNCGKKIGKTENLANKRATLPSDEPIRIPLLPQQNDAQGGEGEGDDGPGESAGFHAGKGMG